MVGILASGLSCPRFNSQHSQHSQKNFRGNFFDGAALKNVDSGLKMLIEPIQYWLVASQLELKHSLGRKCSGCPIGWTNRHYSFNESRDWLLIAPFLGLARQANKTTASLLPEILFYLLNFCTKAFSQRNRKYFNNSQKAKSRKTG